MVVVVLLWITSVTSHKTSTDGAIAVFDTSQLNPATLTRIGLQRPGRNDITLHFIDQQWWLKKPLTVRANQDRVATLISITTATSKQGFRAAGNSLRQFGLDPATMTLWLNDRALAIGNREPLSKLRYVRLNDQVHLVDDRWSGTLFSSVLEFVSPHLLPQNSAVTMLKFPLVRWDYRGGKWSRQPAATGPGQQIGAKLAAAWSQARALLVQPYSPALAWQGELTVGLKGVDKIIRFEFLQNTTGLYLARRDLGIRYLLSNSAAEKLLDGTGSG